MAGTLYRAPAPGEPAFVKEGDKVVKGQTICIIEAMKLMNEIEVCSGSALLCCRALNGHHILLPLSDSRQYVIPPLWLLATSHGKKTAPPFHASHALPFRPPYENPQAEGT